MNRRGFLSSILALAAAPAIVRASSLMPIAVLEEPLIDVSSMTLGNLGLLKEELHDIIYDVGPFEGDIWITQFGTVVYHKKNWVPVSRNLMNKYLNQQSILTCAQTAPALSYSHP